ncbi:hypothetical protein SUGI_0781710 [Cryptomeria japonica]|uniref:antifungal protein ginkbilobin-like protein n=1 Tax=Cryptomeria japonica TaxID=3369 RepID=UPI0024147F11|nr:antifungal protein ginkbilobin-like protein [Cryptomeria japonica]GLJ38388.1 hypothetical protein SUGI_0781710 [Cryptomeria japonica]
MSAPLYLAALLPFSVVMVESSDEIYAACNVVNYSNGSQFDTNVEALLKNLTEKAAYIGFGASVYGLETSSHVSGHLQCRGDLSPADCGARSTEAMKVVHYNCPNAIGSRVQLEHSFLRYENYTFISD